MISVKADGTIKMMGTENDILSDVTIILRIWFQNTKEVRGEEETLEMLKKIGELAVMPEEEFIKGPKPNEN